MAFFLKTVGGLRLVDLEGKDVAFSEKGLLVAAYLLTTPSGAADRATLADFLWNHADGAASLVNLRQAISRIKARQAELGIQFLVFEEGLVRVDGTVLSSDVVWNDGETADPFLKLQRLVATLNRAFLGPTRPQTPNFQAWLTQQTTIRANSLKATLRGLSGFSLDDEQAEIVKEAAIVLFRLQPNDSDTLQLLVKIFNAEGDVDYLRRQFEQRSDLLSRGIGGGGAASHKNRPPATAAAAERQVSFEAEKTQAIAAALPCLVLLPPTNQSGDLNAGVIASSLIEDITIGFCTLNSVQVMAPYSAVRIGAQADGQSAFFERHSVNYVLETRVMRLGGELSLFAQLVFFDDSKIVWAERFGLANLDLDLARGRRVLSKRIALSVSGEIERHETTRSYIELNATAYHRFLLGKNYMNKLTLPNLRRARKEMRGSLQASADFAPALSSVARTYSKEWLLTARGDIELLKTAETFASQAIEARSDMSDGYREYGVARLLQGAFDESVEAMELAVTLSPHYADVIADYADTLVHCSQPAMALQKIERAIELNPLSPDAYLWTAAGANYALGAFDASLQYIDQMADPSLADRLSAASWAMLGSPDKAGIFVRRVREANPLFDVDEWLSAVPSKEQWHKDLYREGLKRAGF